MRNTNQKHKSKTKEMIVNTDKNKVEETEESYEWEIETTKRHKKTRNENNEQTMARDETNKMKKTPQKKIGT